MYNVIICYMPMAFAGWRIHSSPLLIKMAVQISEHGMIDKVSWYVCFRRNAGLCTGLPRKGDVKFPVIFSSSDVVHFTYWTSNEYSIFSGPGSSVDIATELGAGRSGDRIPVGVRCSARVQTGPGAHPASYAMGTGSFPGVKCGRGVTLTTHLLLAPRSWKSRAIPLPTL
jgi:hypothetical protein